MKCERHTSLAIHSYKQWYIFHDGWSNCQPWGFFLLEKSANLCGKAINQTMFCWYPVVQRDDIHVQCKLGKYLGYVQRIYNWRTDVLMVLGHQRQLGAQYPIEYTAGTLLFLSDLLANAYNISLLACKGSYDSMNSYSYMASRYI